MTSKRKSFLIHIDSLDILDDLTNEQAGELFKAIKSHQTGEDAELSPLVKIAFSPFKNQFARDDEKYKKTCEARAAAGSKGGKQKQQNIANASNCKQKVANVADNKNKNKSDSKSDSDKEDQKKVSQKLDYSCWPEMPNEDLFDEWKKLRKRLKANISQVVINRTGKELSKAVGMGYTINQCFETWIYKGWRGFEADWLRNSTTKPQSQGVNQMGSDFSAPEGWQ